jgi:uncharacterized coiled-coil protein SlyX
MVDYSKLTPILVKAIQEQDLKIKEQQKQIDFLKQQLFIIAEKLKSLEKKKKKNSKFSLL